MTLGQYGELHGLEAYHQEKTFPWAREGVLREDLTGKQHQSIIFSSAPESTKTWRGRETWVTLYFDSP